MELPERAEGSTTRRRTRAMSLGKEPALQREVIRIETALSNVEI
jgi:hypothetical protein